MLLKEVIPESILFSEIKEGYVKQQNHPTLPLAILNYTHKTQFDQRWNEATLKCRGLIVNLDTNEVVARPFPKFFNRGDMLAPELRPGDIVSAYDKMDGSLGIMYPDLGGPKIATRGSFTSDQANAANFILQDLYPDFDPPDGYTLMFEIIYPENRIVVDYGDEADLYLLGVVEIETGYIYPADEAMAISQWEGPTAQPLAQRQKFSDVLMLPEREGQEGMVVYKGNHMVKIKQADYVELHRLLSGLNERYIWAWLRDEKPLDDLLRHIPEEFWEWAEKTAFDLQREAQTVLSNTQEEYESVLDSLPELMEACPDWSERKAFAFKAMAYPDSGWLFALYDQKSLWPKIWDSIHPAGVTNPFNRSEDVA